MVLTLSLGVELRVFRRFVAILIYSPSSNNGIILVSDTSVPPTLILTQIKINSRFSLVPKQNHNPKLLKPGWAIRRNRGRPNGRSLETPCYLRLASDIFLKNKPNPFDFVSSWRTIFPSRFYLRKKVLHLNCNDYPKVFWGRYSYEITYLRFHS